MPGTVLLLAASRAGKRCLVDAAPVLPVPAAILPAVLSGTDTDTDTDTANVVEYGVYTGPDSAKLTAVQPASAPVRSTAHRSQSPHADARAS